MFSRSFTRLMSRAAAALCGAALAFGLAANPAHGLTPSDAQKQLGVVDTSTPLASPIPLLPDKVAETVAEYTVGPADGVPRALRAPGADSFPDKFVELSPLQQVQWGYASVDLKTPGTGEVFVAALINHVAQTTPSILSEPMAMALLKKHKSPPNTFSFDAQLPPQQKPVMEPQVARAIAVIADVIAEQGSGFSARKLMERRLGLKTADVIESMLKFGSSREALADRLSRLANPPQKRLLAEIAMEIMEAMPAARTDKALGEAVFRWLAVDDPAFGEWSRIRDILIENVEQGKLQLPPEKEARAQRAARQMRADFARMPGMFLNRGLKLRVADVERMFLEYANRQPEVAALWGFAVIGLKSDFDYERYVEESASTLRRRYLQLVQSKVEERTEQNLGRNLTVPEKVMIGEMVEKEHGNALDWTAEARDHGPKPHHGYTEYVRLTGFQSAEKADTYFSSAAVQNAVGAICPAGE
jgi:hypothetical protein